MQKLSLARLSNLLLALSLLFTSASASAETAQEINIKVDAALERFLDDVEGGDRFLQAAVGVLVFPSVLKAGIGVGGEYGEGALRVNGETIEYYNTAAASIGFQFGAQTKAVYLLFMNEDALAKFRTTSGWRAGVDGSINLIKMGAGGTIDTNSIQDPIIGFVLTNRGLMYNLTLEGSKYTKIVK
jgi:lipid-binding SYLF domain-containing protein